MIAQVVAIALLAGSLCLTAGAVIQNQMDPSFSTAMTVPIVNVVSLIGALLGMVVAIAVYRKNRDTMLAKRTMQVSIVCAVTLVLLFPLSDMGYLSKVQ